jgi:hypothetical protein
MPEDVLELEHYTERIKAENERAFNHIRTSVANLLLADHLERLLREQENERALQRLHAENRSPAGNKVSLLSSRQRPADPGRQGKNATLE